MMYVRVRHAYSLGMSLIKGPRHNYCAEGGWSLGTYNYKCAAGRRSERGLGNGGGGWSGAFSHVVEKDVVGPSSMVVESDSVGP